MSNNQSTGPKSAAGKEVSSMNATKHGLSAQKWLTPELSQYYKGVLGSLMDEYLPQTPTEVLMIERVATTITKAKRLNDLENAQYELARELVMEEYNKPSIMRRSGILKLGTDNIEKNQELIRLQLGASMPSLEVMNIINRQQNSLSRQLSKELSELITVINLNKNIKVVTTRAERVERPDVSEWDFE